MGSAWSDCEPPCGQGLSMRTRTIERPGQNGGLGCTMDLKQAKGCFTTDCSGFADCKWGAWQHWGKCHRAQFCGIGHRKRTRDIEVYPKGGGRACAPLNRVEVAPFEECPGSCETRCTDAKWGEWSSWSQCSASCGSGFRRRSRSAAREADVCGLPLAGNADEYKLCHAAAPCADAVDCEFSDWDPWSPKECSSMCNGHRQHSRWIKRPAEGGGRPCEGSITEDVRCNPAAFEPSPPACADGAGPNGTPIDCTVGDWSVWSACSAPCGPGFKVRSRSVLQEPMRGGVSCTNPLKAIAGCHSVPCGTRSVDCELSDWEDWGHCNHRTGQQRRERHIAVHKSSSGLDCQGQRVEVKGRDRGCFGTRHHCSWGEWTPWSLCSATCGEGRNSRKRKLVVSDRMPLRELRVEERYSLLSEDIEKLSGRHTMDVVTAFAGGFISLLLFLGLRHRLCDSCCRRNAPATNTHAEEDYD